MKAKKLVLAAALLAALPAFAGDNKPKEQSADSSMITAPAASTNQPAASASTNAPAASAEAPAAQPMPSFEQKKSARAGDESVKQLQQSLKDKGFDPGPIDGVMGPRTQAAIDQEKQASASASTSQPAPSASTSQPEPSASTSQPSPSASTNQPSAATESTPAKQ